MKVNIRREDCFNFVVMFWVGVVLYFYILMGKTPNPDTIWCGVTKYSWEWEAQLGRFMIKTWQEIFGHTTNALFMTVASLLFYSLSAVLIIRLFEIKGQFWQIVTGLMSVIIVPSTWCTLTYYYCSAYYAAAYLLVVLAFYIMVRSQWHILVRYAVVVAMLVISLGTYQAYLSMWFTLGILYAIFMIIKGENERNIFFCCMKF